MPDLKTKLTDARLAKKMHHWLKRRGFDSEVTKHGKGDFELTLEYHPPMTEAAAKGQVEFCEAECRKDQYHWVT